MKEEEGTYVHCLTLYFQPTHVWLFASAYNHQPHGRSFIHRQILLIRFLTDSDYPFGIFKFFLKGFWLAVIPYISTF